jgi:pyruvate kinase
MPVYAATDDDDVARRLCLWWGICPIVDPLDGDADAVTRRVVDRLRERRALPAPAAVVIVSANPDLAQPRVNFVALRRV